MNIQQILNDLYEYDASLKKHEAELTRIIAELIRLKPDTKFDENFAKILKQQLLAKASLMEKPKGVYFMNYFKYLVPTALVAALALVTVNYYQKQQAPGMEELFVAGQQVENVGKEAFGKLAINQTNEAMPYAAGLGAGPQANSASGEASVSTRSSLESSNTAVMQEPLADGYEDLPAPATDPKMSARPQSGGGYGGDATSMIYPYPSFKYVYKGDEFTVENEQAVVYKRLKNSFNAAAVNRALQNMNFGLFNLKSFSNLSVQSLNLVEDKDFGYNFTIDFIEGRVSIYENWQKWLTPDRQCQTTECYEQHRLKPSDIPADEEVISIAKQFMDDHNIPLENYGEPFVQDYWKRDYELMADKSAYYIPDTLLVVFPIKVEGQEVYDESGVKTGIMVNVNVRVKRVSGLNELTPQTYQASEYGAETDTAKLIALAERGGLRGGYFPMPMAEGSGGQIVEVELGTPKVSLVKYWNYTNNQSEEILVPSLIFPIIKMPQTGYFYQQNIVVPLVSEVIQQYGDPIRIMK